jgi:glycosyltransferase involved in cell wall biosynthesis
MNNEVDPSVSIIVPVYNDPEGVTTTINSLLNLPNKINYQILIVDNNSTDCTQSVVRAYDDQISIYKENICGSYAARNKGIKNADGDIFAFIDADETVNTDWLETAFQAINKQNIDYLGCDVEIQPSERTLISQYNTHTGFPIQKYLRDEHYAPTCALLVRREVFEDVGLFDARLISGGDREFGERVYEAGYKQGYTEDATVYHPARTSFKSLAKKNVRVGRGFCQKQRYYPERYGKPGIPPAPTGPSGANGKDDPDSALTRIAFAFLSVAMLACRGIGYYYEFFFGEERDDIPAPTR